MPTFSIKKIKFLVCDSLYEHKNGHVFEYVVSLPTEMLNVTKNNLGNTPVHFPQVPYTLKVDKATGKVLGTLKQ